MHDMKRRAIHCSEKTITDEPLIENGQNGFLRNLLNAYNVLVPDSERFIIRTVKKYLPTCAPALRHDVSLLFFQEGQHARETQKTYAWLQKKYRIHRFKTICFGLTYGWIEKIAPNRLLLSLASAIEHINTSTADYFLMHDDILTTYPKYVRDIYYWHFAEEIEHKHVVFDVLQEQSKANTLRILGMILAAVGFMSLLVLGGFVFSFQDRSLFKRHFWTEFWHFLVKKQGLLRTWCQRIMWYTKPSFHPNDIDNTSLIAKALQHIDMSSLT